MVGDSISGPKNTSPPTPLPSPAHPPPGEGRHRPTASSAPLSAHTRPRDRLFGGSEDEGIEERLGLPAGECAGGQVDGGEVGPRSGSDAADVEADGVRSANRRGVEEDARDLPFAV